MAKLFRREQHSLFGEILDWMLTPLLLLWPVSLALTWLVAQNIAGRPFDRGLEYNVQALAQLVKSDQTRMYFNLPLPAREILRADEADLIYYQVLGTKGEFVSGERDFPLPPDEEQPQPSEVRLRQSRPDLGLAFQQPFRCVSGHVHPCGCRCTRSSDGHRHPLDLARGPAFDAGTPAH